MTAAPTVLRLRIAGPGLDVVELLSPGEPALVLGRDADCSVCLPDPLRNVSRKHLSVWNDDGELRYQVLSVVNGIEVPAGAVPPGGKGVLQPGETLKLAEYSVLIERRAEPAEDPWAVFEREPSGVSPLPQGLDETQPRPATRERIEGDPFGDWGFETTFGPGGISGAALDAASLAAAPDTAPFFHGLGIDPASVGTLSVGELELIGRLVRALALGVLELHAAAAESKRDLNAEDRTRVGARGGINPLKTGASPADKLHYLFGGRAASAGFDPERSLGEVLRDLLTHESASRAATRAVVEGALREFDPETLKARLLGGRGGLFGAARAWDAYARFYAERRDEMPQWAQQLLDRHFAEAYVRETVARKGRG